jgi:predicted alpha/beta-fold hydrolase
MNYTAPWWLPGGNLQTIWAALCAQRFEGAPPTFRRERWTTPDQDFVDVDWLDEPSDPAAQTPGDGASRPLLVLFHGLEGSSASHYAQAFAHVARTRGWAFAVPHFRGCSGQMNLAPRAYHSGDFAEIDWMLRRFNAAHDGPVLAAGVSLGGNALMRWAAEMGESASRYTHAVASICSPLDLAAGGRAIGRGFNRLVYTRMFLRTMVPKALAKLDQHPGLFEREAMLGARDLYTFDNVFTAPVHGFASTDDYWARASAKPGMRQIRIPALALNAGNDPFVPGASLPQVGEVSAHVTLWQPGEGGHVGFPAASPDHGWPRTHALHMPDAVADYLAQHL